MAVPVNRLGRTDTQQRQHVQVSTNSRDTVHTGDAQVGQRDTQEGLV